jgi:phosphatidylglycerophosphate synthase
VLAVLVAQGELAARVVVVILGREVLIAVLRSVSAAQGHVLARPWPPPRRSERREADEPAR